MIFIVPHDMPASQDHFNTPKKLTIGFNFKIVKYFYYDALNTLADKNATVKMLP
jgi:hypothetical protein